MNLNKAQWLVLAALLIFSSAGRWRAHALPQAADNSKQNQDRSAPTADQQKMDAADRKTTQEVRKSILADRGLSTYAHNVKVITQHGQLTLRGPVRSQEEKQTVESKAAAVAGKEHVTSYIDIVPAK